MRRLTGLRRQIVLSMTAVALAAVLIVILGAYAFYALVHTFWPAGVPVRGAWMPSGPQWAWMVAATAAALTLAVTVAIKLSRRILSPLTSVAESLRQMAQGDLDARAVSDDRSLGEGALLVDDFNAMAQRLQRMAQEQAFWNAAIAHELRTPVTILRGRLQGLAEGVFTPDEPQFRNLLAQVEGLTRLIEDLRVVGMADSGHLTLQRREADLATDVKAVVQLFEADLRTAGLVPVLDLDEGHPVQCDPERIRQALLALLDNARRHAVPGEVRIRLRVQQAFCHLQVEDDGPGIPPALAIRVFEAFQRGDPSRSRASAGSGLGLAVVRAIAQSHGGHARCRSSPTGGTAFEVGFPV